MRTEGENQPGVEEGLQEVGLRLVSYRKWLLGVIAVSVAPYLQQRLAEVGIDWGWGRFRGPQMLDGVWNFVAARPVEAVVVAAAFWFIAAATWRTTRSPRPAASTFRV